MSDAILSIKELKVNYGGIEAVKGISFDVPRGQIVTLIGANGAGKSSTLRAIAGLVKPKSGAIQFEGETITGRGHDVHRQKGDYAGSRRPADFRRPYGIRKFAGGCLFAQGQHRRGR